MNEWFTLTLKECKLHRNGWGLVEGDEEWGASASSNDGLLNA